ncbi:sugar phosphate isomerase/epimerase family protein [Puerhibacterium puerhi]|uniref:sugar phosphate isomerase/epimerase family protein n=1 Tax=Puerhibacterium puerhi TaxID=2692623 RepID=UPI001357619B|nr:sugar phosphate isomerase/epimerase [Puerhibacterium puerhi]
MSTPAAAASTQRVGISTITFRFRPFEEAVRLIAATGAEEVDLGALPGVCDHVPVPFTGDPQDYVAELERHGLRAGAVNGDVGPLNDPALDAETLTATALPLVRLAAATGGALILPAGGQSWDPYVDEAADLERIAANLRLVSALAAEHGVRLLAEVLHHRRFAWSAARADRVLELLGPDQIGLLLDTSHVVASDEDLVAWATKHAARVERVHLRDAVPGNLNLGIGRGKVDFRGTMAALEAAGFAGTYVLELETHDVEEHEREADAQRSYDEMTALVAEVQR